MMIDTPIHVHDSEFQTQILNADLPVIVDFWAPWCNPCKMIAPSLEKLAKDFAGKLIVAKINTDEDPQWAGQYGVQGIPTLLMIYKGKIIHRQTGAAPEPVLREVVEQFLDVVNEK
ncbi:MAG TPA: thioredoxin [Anaerolineaceae bacterium]|nr:thioredoxin [Anaerolineaceae bacterium]HPN51657.1 thioredoxin [Anaerolineaceae bacterium]